MASIIGIPTTRVSNTFIQQRLLSQVQYNQTELFRLQTQLSTGRRFEAPSEDPVASMRIVDIQRLMERKKQVYGNVEINQSYLTATDVALSDVSGMIADIRGAAMGVLGTAATDVQRQAAVQQIDQVIQQLLDTGNQQFRGRYLFAGSATQTRPFRMTETGSVEYLGNEESIQSYSDLNTLFVTNMTGDEAFGAVSTVVEGSIDLEPVVKYDTHLADLSGGLGISPGSISISDGTSSIIVDLSSAETVGDVAQLLKANPPNGNSVEIEIVPEGFRIRLTAGNLTINEVGGGTVAQELGILETTGAGAAFVESRDLNPILRITTNLDDAFGAKAQAVVRSAGGDNNIIIRGPTQGTAYNGITISYIDTAIAGSETVTYDAAGKTLIVGIEAGESTAADVVDTINNAPLCPLTAELDPLDDVDGGNGNVDVTVPSLDLITAFGTGRAFDKTNGLRIVNDETTTNISFATVETVEDMLNTLNGSGDGLLADISQDKTGINIHSRISGADFTIGENGGTTAADLGLRTFTADVPLDSLNFGNGTHTHTGIDFTVTRADGVVLDIDLDTAEDIQDVLNLINNNPLNVDGPLAPGVVTARLAAYGNGIELVDDSLGSASLTVTRSQLSTAAIDLGLIPEGAQDATAGTSNVFASGTLVLAGPNNDLRFDAQFPGTYGNVNVIFNDTGAESCAYDPVANTLTFEINHPVTDANRIITLLGGSLASGLFTASLTTDDPAGNTGAGPVPMAGGSMANGRAEVLTGTDSNPQETEGIFTALLRLRDALEVNDVLKAQQAIDLLDSSITDLNFSRAELGARQQSLDILQDRLETEEIELKGTLSLEYDIDIVQVISDFTARQVAYEASLKAMGSISQLSLLDYL